MSQRDDQLLGQLARRNWLVLALLLLISVFWRSPQLSAGVLAGGLLAIGGFLWLQRSLHRAIADPAQYGARSFQVSYLLRLAALALLLLIMVALVKVHPIGLALGLSVVVINIFWTTLTRSVRTRRP